MPKYPTFRAFGSRAILVEWQPEINEKILHQVLNTKTQLENLIHKQILYINNTYNSILITYKSTIDNINVEISYIKSYLSEDNILETRQFKHWEIPTCYDEKFALDLEELSKKNRLSKSEIITLHSETIYTIYFIGFLPGFLYLGGLDSRLYIDRKSTPRLKLKKGSVGIGGQQTGIYPKSSPGGWNIIGNSPINFFNVENKNPCFAKAGDKVSFRSISLEEYEIILNKVELNEYEVKEL